MSRGQEEVWGGGFGRRLFPPLSSQSWCKGSSSSPESCPLSNWVKGKAPSPTCCCLCGFTTDTGQTWQRNIKQTRVSNTEPVLVSPQIPGSGRAALPSSGDYNTSLTGDSPAAEKHHRSGPPLVQDRYAHVCCAEIGKDRHMQEIIT